MTDLRAFRSRRRATVTAGYGCSVGCRLLSNRARRSIRAILREFHSAGILPTVPKGVLSSAVWAERPHDSRRAGGATLRRRSEAHRHQLRNSGLLHGYAVEHRRDAHGLLAVRDEHELGLQAHLLHQLGKAADVGLVERSIHFVEDAEGTRLILEDGDQQS